MANWENVPEGEWEDVTPDNSSGIVGYLLQKKREAMNIPSGIAEPIMQLGTGMIAKPISEIAGMAAAGREMISPQGGDPEAFRNYVQSGLTYQPRTVAGQSQYNPLNAVLSGLGNVIDYGTTKVGEATKALTGSDIAASGMKEASGQALGLLGMKKASVIAKSIPEKQAALNILKEQNFPTDSVINQGVKSGYKFTPDELSKFGAGHPIGSSLEDVSALHVYHLNREASALDAKASAKNYGITLQLVRDDLKLPNGQSLPKSTAISDATLDKFIGQHGKVYQAVSNIKEPIIYTDAYKAAIMNLEGDMAAAIKQYPNIMKTEGLSTLQSDLLSGKPSGAGTKYYGYEVEHGMPYNIETKASTNAAAAMQLIKKLRADASKVLSNTDIKPEALALAKLQKKAASAVEGLLEQHLQSTGKSALFKTFQNSRTQIAKAYELKNALEGTVLSTAKLARNGDGLTGNLKVIQDMQLQHPNLMIDPRSLSTTGGGLAANAAVGGVVALSGHPIAGAAIAGRPFLGMMTLSKPYQKAFSKTPSYKAGTMTPQALGMLSAPLPYLNQEQQ